MGLLALDLGDDVKHLRVRTAGAAGTLLIRLTLRLTGALTCNTHTHTHTHTRTHTHDLKVEMCCNKIVIECR